MGKCAVCLGMTFKHMLLCHPCGKSYAKIGGPTSNLIEWAAKRARYYERKRNREKQP